MEHVLNAKHLPAATKTSLDVISEKAC